MKTLDQKLGWILLLLTGVFYYLSSQLPEDAAFYPLFITILLAVLSIIFLIKTYRNTYESKQVFNGLELKQLILITVVSGGYIALINVLGYFVTTFLYFITVLIGLKVEKKKLMLISVGFCGFVFILFKLLLKVRLPQGLII